MSKKHKYIKPFELDGETFAETCHMGSIDGPLIIDIEMTTLTVAQARKLSAWLLKAADEVTAHNKKRRRTVVSSDWDEYE